MDVERKLPLYRQVTDLINCDGVLQFLMKEVGDKAMVGQVLFVIFCYFNCLDDLLVKVQPLNICAVSEQSGL